MESLIDKEIASLFDCDSVIDNFLSESGDEATYEMLSDKLKNTIWDRFDGEDGSLFVNILSTTDFFPVLLSNKNQIKKRNEKRK